MPVSALFTAATIAAVSAGPVATRDIIVTAALVPVEAQNAPASVTVFNAQDIQRMGAPFVVDYLRLAPGTSVVTNGSTGTRAEVRIRGAESSHSLLFVDGIDFNDVASANAARFETLSADGLDRIEILRGPASALFGSEALGGVVALSQADPLGATRASAALEYGSRDARRANATFSSGGEKAGISASASWSRSDGIDIFGGGTGDRDGYESYHISLKAVARPGDGDGEFGVVAHYLHHDVAYDGTPAPFYIRADTAETSLVETWAFRGWASWGIAPDAPWSVTIDASVVDNSNRNRDAGVRTNDSLGKRTRIGGKIVHRFGLAGASHELIGLIEREDEDFGTRDLLYGGSSDQNRNRGRTAFVGEWRADWGFAHTDVAVRHDAFNRFEDETTLRANVVVPITTAISAIGGYGEGIAQPNFADLFGFSPLATFTPNPALRPEKSRGFEAGLRYATPTLAFDVVAFSNNLRDEIVEDFGVVPYTIVNAPGTSRRRGIEVSAGWRPDAAIHLTANYTYLDSRERRVSGSPTLREIRRPRHSANATAEWHKGPITAAGSVAWVGKRRDTDFDTYTNVMLKDYALVGARIAYALTSNVETFARIENALDANYQDVVGYAMPGRAVYAGVRFRLGDRP